jgi:fucose 4-O-acetylase-like acetyltransferase
MGRGRQFADAVHMQTTPAPSPSELARLTPESRDRYVDFLRVVSIGVVVIGHWLMAVVSWRGDSFETANVLALVPGLWAATWLLQVMPLFFFVGGFANSVTIDAHRRRGLGASEFVASRVRRLVLPVAVLLGVWLPAAFVLDTIGMHRGVLHAATKLVCQPLWFIGVYLLVVALAPTMRDLHDRGRTAVVLALAAAVALVDIARFSFGVDALGYLNVLSMWLLAQQIGFFYADGSLVRLRPFALVTAAGIALSALVALTTFGPYPASMVGLPGERISNMSPPTICLVALTAFQVCLVMLVRPAVGRWLERERVWTVVIAGNGAIMTIFLWHLTALLVAISVLHFVGFPQPAGGSWPWWASRPVVMVIATAFVAVFVRCFARFERPGRAEYRARNLAPVVGVGLGVTLLAVAAFGVASSNIVDLLDGTRVRVAVITITSLHVLACALLGWSLLIAAVRRLPVAPAPR